MALVKLSSTNSKFYNSIIVLLNVCIQSYLFFMYFCEFSDTLCCKKNVDTNTENVGLSMSCCLCAIVCSRR